MNEPPIRTLEEIVEHAGSGTAVWHSRTVRQSVDEVFGPTPATLCEWPDHEPDAGADQLIAVGGGTLLDHAKIWRHEQSPTSELVAVASIWGSGAEVSPIAVQTVGRRKVISCGAHLLPDARAIWPKLAQTVPESRALDASGDVWAHALEGFLSPLASDELRLEIARIINDILKPRPYNDPAWFDLGARACRAQSRSSVGLVHGMAHVLEPHLEDAPDGPHLGHAALCRVLVWPVFKFNLASPTTRSKLEANGLEPEALDEALRSLHDPELFDLLIPALDATWPEILRDRCSRTNGVLVRPSSLGFFVQREFQ